MKPDKYDFSGWATKNDIRCSDGRVIRRDAFKDCDGKTVPLVWNHDHSNPENVLGHAYLENRENGVYAYGSFNNNQMGREAKEMLQHGDITNLSIYANHLKHMGSDVIHGMIREVSLVLAGANPGASIDYVLAHADNMYEEAEEGMIYTDEEIELYHSEDKVKKPEDLDEDEEDEDEDEDENSKSDSEEEDDEDVKHSDEGGKSPKEVFDAMTEEQQAAVYAIVGAAVEDAKNESNNTEDNSQEDEEVKHNVFDNEFDNENTLSHADTEAIFADAKRYGTLSESCLQHGITNIDVMFPDAKNISNDPSLISRDMDWVSTVLNKTHHTPFSRVRSIHANITADEARARGYVKGNLKVEEVITALRRETTPQTIYKKQALDRDDIIDITDFNVVAFLKAEMRVMLNEEIARAILIGDGRAGTSPDKIQETNIRPVWKDDALYTVNKTITKSTPSQEAKDFIVTAIKARKEYKGSGNPVLYISEDLLTEMLLLEDGIGRPLYDTMEKLKTKLRVSDIIPVPVFEDQEREVSGVTHYLGGIIVNLTDYNVGADKGGAISMFDDFDIDYNKEKYLIETRCSGALTIPYSAIAIDFIPASNSNSEPAEDSEVVNG